jgi:fatty acid desaturase
MRSNSTAYVHILARFSILACLAYATYTTSKYNILSTLMVFYAYCVVYNFSSWVGIGHELAHGTLFKSKSLNTCFLKLFSNLTLSNEALFLATHFEHHKNPHGCNDFESPYSCLPRQKPSWNHRLYALIDFPKLISTAKYLWLNSRGFIPQDKLKYYLEKRKKVEIIAQSAREKIAFVFVIIIASILLKSIWPFLFLVLPNFIGTCLIKNLALLQHPSHLVLGSLNLLQVRCKDINICIEDLDVMQVRDCLDVELPLLFQFLYANMNYHATHHRNPSIPMYHLIEASSNLEASGNSMKIDISLRLLIRLMIQPI